MCVNTWKHNIDIRKFTPYISKLQLLSTYCTLSHSEELVLPSRSLLELGQFQTYTWRFLCWTSIWIHQQILPRAIRTPRPWLGLAPFSHSGRASWCSASKGEKGRTLGASLSARRLTQLPGCHVTAGTLWEGLSRFLNICQWRLLGRGGAGVRSHHGLNFDPPSIRSAKSGWHYFK